MRLRRSTRADAATQARPAPVATAPDAISEQVLAAAAALPQDPRLVVFESMSGRQYSDSPRAVSEALERLGLDIRIIWSTRRGATGMPGHLSTVIRRSPEWIEAMATARVWVDNQGFARWLPKPTRIHYLQTWHGTPLKKMGWNDPALADVNPDIATQLQASYDRWDAITAPSEYFVESIVNAFRSPAQVLRMGMPRNDVLVRTLSTEEMLQRRAALGIDQQRRVVLFAPTRTADPHVSEGRWAAAESIVRDDRAVLFRGHYSDDEVPAHAGSQVRDVSGVADMADLLAVADVLITDYSSSMFDFALTDRPIILFQPDQSGYLNDRGAYFDIREFSPGPIATTRDHLVSLVDTVDQWSTDWSSRRSEYRERFGTYEKGDAADRVAREHLAPILDA